MAYGFTPALRLDDPKHFVEELIKAGKRKMGKHDEIDAFSEKNVLHVALSYGHAAAYYNGGTINEDIANRAYEIVYDLALVASNSKVNYVRVWIDQNIHRYEKAKDWYEVGFLPYACLPVISVPPSDLGFKAALTRPWIWVETGMAMKAKGLNCHRSVASTIPDALWVSSVVMKEWKDTSQKLSHQKDIVSIKGNGFTMEHCIFSILKTVSWWSPNILEHKSYEYAKDFDRFKLWARAQLTRLSNSNFNLNVLNSNKLSETWIDRIAWIRSLPSTLPLKQSQTGQIKLDMKKEHRNELVEVVKALSVKEILPLTSASDENPAVLWHLYGDPRIRQDMFDQFCIMEKGDVIHIDYPLTQEESKFYQASPHKQLDALFDFNITKFGQSIEEEMNMGNPGVVEMSMRMRKDFKKWNPIGCFSPDNFKPQEGEPQKLITCGRIFGVGCSERKSLGHLKNQVLVGNNIFKCVGSMYSLFVKEKVYSSIISNDVVSQQEILLPELDVLIFQLLDPILQNDIIKSITVENTRRLAVQISSIPGYTGETEIGTPSQFTMGTAHEEIISRYVGHHMENLLRESGKIIVYSESYGGKIGHTLFHFDDEYGPLLYAYESNLVIPSAANLIHLKRGVSSIEETLAKIAIMRGSKRHELLVGERGITLHGGEIFRCKKTGKFFSPINWRVCSFEYNERGEIVVPIVVKWGDLYEYGQFETFYPLFEEDADEWPISGPVDIPSFVSFPQNAFVSDDVQRQ